AGAVDEADGRVAERSRHRRSIACVRSAGRGILLQLKAVAGDVPARVRLGEPGPRTVETLDDDRSAGRESVDLAGRGRRPGPDVVAVAGLDGARDAGGPEQ